MLGGALMLLFALQLWLTPQLRLSCSFKVGVLLESKARFFTHNVSGSCFKDACCARELSASSDESA